jgi:hypothetical protein
VALWIEHIHFVLIIAAIIVQPLLNRRHVVADVALSLVGWSVEVIDLADRLRAVC